MFTGNLRITEPNESSKYMLVGTIGIWNTYLGQNNIAQTITSADKSTIQMMTSFSASLQAMNYFSSGATFNFITLQNDSHHFIIS